MIFDALPNAAYREPLRGPGAELEGGGLTSPQQVVENLQRPSRARVNRSVDVSRAFMHKMKSFNSTSA